jgi:hypothetical protein
MITLAISLLLMPIRLRLPLCILAATRSSSPAAVLSFKSVVAAAEADDSYKVIGVDVDQYSQATDKVITSAEKS